MNELVKPQIDAATTLMEKAISHLDAELSKIRAGKASPAMLEVIYVDYYGTNTPLSQVANVNTIDAHTITVQPWEKQMLHEIERAIMIANLGFNPMNNGEMVIINVPVLTEERRKELVKRAKSECENSKVGIRNLRKDANERIKKNIKENDNEAENVD